MRFETCCVGDHPEGVNELKDARIPLLFEEGNTLGEFIHRKTGGHRPPLQ